MKLIIWRWGIFKSYFSYLFIFSLIVDKSLSDYIKNETCIGKICKARVSENLFELEQGLQMIILIFAKAIEVEFSHKKLVTLNRSYTLQLVKNFFEKNRYLDNFLFPPSLLNNVENVNLRQLMLWAHNIV